MLSISQLVQRIKNSAAVKGLARWLSDLTAYAPVSIVVPSTSSQSKGLPSVEEFKGLCAVCELRDANGTTEWQFFWESYWAADKGEAQYIRDRGAATFSRCTVQCADAVKPHWWRRAWPWTIATGFLASVAAAGSNVESIKGLYSQLRHDPVVTVETTDVLRAGSGRSREVAEVTLRGDPYFRTSIDRVRMRISPEDSTLKLPHDGLVDVPSSNLSIDVSAPIVLRLPLGKLPAGKYRIDLTGVTHTSWHSADLSMEKPLVLEVRKPVALRNTLVKSYPSAPGSDGSFSEGLAEFALDFGRMDQSVADVRVVLRGDWVDWSMQFHPTKASLAKESDNSAGHPKSIIFSLQKLPVTSFTTDVFRIWAKSAVPMTEDEWRAQFARSVAQITSME